ncbi:MAG: TraR/DksA C4-type zinc finger protein [Verrucomicrobiota bacterium]
MPAIHSTNRTPTAKSSKQGSTKDTKPSAPVKATPKKAHAVNKTPVKPVGKAPVTSKAVAKKAIAKPAPKKVTPAPKKVTPAPKKATPAPKKVTPAPKKATPAPKKVTPAPKKATPAPKKVTPAPKKVTQAPKKVTPAPKKVTPAPNKAKVEPPSTKATPIVKAAASKHPKTTPEESQKASGKQQVQPRPVTAPAAPITSPPADKVSAAVVEKSVPKMETAEPKKDRSHEPPSKKPAVRRSALVDFPVPPPPVRPPFVPPKPQVVHREESAPSGSNGSHSIAFVQKQRQRLLDLRDDLVDALSGMTRDTIRNAPEGSEASGSGMHQGDAGSDAYDRDFALSVLAKEQDALYEIDQALRRIQKNIYGVCEMSNRKIPQARLEAIPFARLTVECQAQWEKEYGNRRFRPSNEVGFSGGNLMEDEDSETVLLDDDED